METVFNRLVASLLEQVRSPEHFTLQLAGERSQFIRFNQAKVRQTGCVVDGGLILTLMADQRRAYRRVPITTDWEQDWSQLQAALEELRSELPQLPVDPYLTLPDGTATSRDIHKGNLLLPEAAVDAILPEVQGLDFTGIYSGGTLIRAYADSVGQRHWFETESFALDYSIFTTDGQAVKGTLAGSEWDRVAYSNQLGTSRRQLERLGQPAKTIPKGQYRTYLAPAAVAELIGLFSWGGIGEASLQQGYSALGLLQRGEKVLSPAFTLREDFRDGLYPRFNDLGEVVPLELVLIEQGKLVNTLVSSRSAREYGKESNGASGEYLRSPVVLPGTLPPDRILSQLERGLYVSNLHYLNWSDRPTGRITGMTRYACFWVDGGELVAPIEHLRFDESLYRFLGSNLMDLTTITEYMPEVGTYESRHPGGVRVPGMLVEEFTYTL